VNATTRARSALPTALLLLGITLVALAVRLPSFTDSLWGDELSTNFVVNGFGVGGVIHILNGEQEGTPPLYFLLTWLTKGLGGVEGLRLVSLLSGLAAIPLVYLVAVRTVGPRAGIVAAALIALSPFQIFYSTEARAYTLSMALALVVCLSLLEAVRGGRRGWWIAYAIAVAAAAYAHYSTVFVLIGLFLWAFFAHPAARKPLILATIGAAVLFIPWIPEFLSDRDEPAAKLIEILAPLTLGSAKRDLAHMYFGHPYIPTTVVPGRLALWIVALGLLAGLAGLAMRLRAQREWPWPPASIALVFVLLLSAPVGAALHNLVAPSVFASRNLITSWPGFALLVGAVVTAGGIATRAVAIALVVAGFGIGAVRMLDEDNQRPDFRDAVSFIERSGPPDAPVVDTPQPSPGIQSPMEAALAPDGQPVPQGRPVFVLTYPTMQVRLEFARRRHVPLLPPLPPRPSDQRIAREAGAAAGRGRLFLVNPGTATLEQLRTSPGPVANFLAALPPRFHEVEFRVFPGLNLGQVSVHVLQGSPSP
jgi:mannosyltransferase